MRATFAGLAVALLASPAAGQLAYAGNQLLMPSALGVSIQAGDEFGAAFAVGDFDGDSFDDLAIGLPGRTISGLTDAGAVLIVYGSLTGLNGAGALPPLLFSQNGTNVLEVSEAGDRFGAALAAGNFDGLFGDDLAVGVPLEDLESGPVVADAGLVHVFYSDANGLQPALDETWHQESFAGLSTNEGGDRFGASLAICDLGFTADAYRDLGIGIPGDNWDGLNNAGAIYSILGTSSGLGTAGAGYSGEPASGTPPAAGDSSGSAIVCLTNANGSRASAIGSPFAEAEGVENSAGIVRLAYSGGSSEVASPYGGSFLGTAVALAESVGSGFTLFAGAPGFDAAGVDEAGGVYFDAINGLLYQGAFGLSGVPEPSDQLGQVLAVGDWNDDGRPDVAFGIPSEDLRESEATPAPNAGIVQVLFQQAHDIGTAAHQNITWDDPEFQFGALANDRFGGALATGDFDGDGVDDLAIGAPGALNGAAEAGLVQILNGERKLVFADNFEVNGLDAWTTTSP